MRKALICGISGQDGAYLAKLLLEKGYQVYGTSRDAQMTHFINLTTLGIRERVTLESVSLSDFRSVLQVLLKVQPDEIYNLAGQSSVGLSFQQPVETLESVATGALNLLEAIRFASRFTGKTVKIYSAASGECFGNTGVEGANENTPFQPRSPYAVAKATAFWVTANYRDAYGLFACSGILFNHESPLRPERFVTQKIVASACRIRAGSKEKLYLGNLAIQRDWGWAPEYVKAMWLMLQQEMPQDYVVATGESHRLEDFVAEVFASLKLDWREHVIIDQELFRPSEITLVKADPSKAEKELGWRAKYRMKDMAQMMVQAELARNPGAN